MVFALLEHILGTRRHTHIIEPAYEVPAEKVDDVLAAVARLAGGEPLQYVLGIACFYGRDFKTSKVNDCVENRTSNGIFTVVKLARRYASK